MISACTMYETLYIQNKYKVSSRFFLGSITTHFHLSQASEKQPNTLKFEMKRFEKTRLFI
jgi:hypothetical protein